MNRDRLDEWLERGILALVLAALVFAPLATGAVRTLEFLIVQAITLGIAVLWLFRCWVNRRVRLLWPPICWAVVAFAGYALFRYFTSDLEYVARQEVTRVLVYAFLFLAILNNLHSREPARIITFTLLFLGMCIAGYAVYQFATGSDRVWHFITPYKGRGTGTFINPNSLAGFLEMLLPLGLAFSLAGRLPAAAKVFVGYASLVILAGIGLSISRAGILSSALAVFLFALMLTRYRNYRIAAILILAALIGGAVVVVKKSDAIRLRMQKIETDVGGPNNRWEMWTSAVEMWEDQPWLGVGPDHFDYRFPEYRTQETQRDAIKVHNDYLNTLVDWGVVGFLIVLSAWICLAVGVVKTWPYVRGGVNTLSDRKGDKFAFVLGASCGLVAILAHSFWDFNMQIPSNAMLAIALMALLTGHLRSATERYWVAGKWPLKLAVSLALAAYLIGLGVLGWQRAREYVWLHRAEQLVEVRGPGVKEPFKRERAEALKQAFAVEPNNFKTAYEIGWIYEVWANYRNWETYEQQAQEAIQWFERAIALNPYDSNAYLRMGHCYDILEEHDRAEPLFLRAAELDPNGFTLCNHVGIHYASRREYAAALPWFFRARNLETSTVQNPTAPAYIKLCERRLLEAAQPLQLPRAAD